MSVRKELPMRTSEPINKKFIVDVLVSCGSGVGPSLLVSGAGGAAIVGKSELRSTVGLGSAGGIAVGEGVGDGKKGSSVGTSML